MLTNRQTHIAYNILVAYLGANTALRRKFIRKMTRKDIRNRDRSYKFTSPEMSPEACELWVPDEGMVYLWYPIAVSTRHKQLAIQAQFHLRQLNEHA